MDEAPTEARVIDEKVLDYYNNTEETGTAKPYIVYLNEDKVEDAEKQNRRRRNSRMLLVAIGLLSLAICLSIFCYGLGKTWK